MISGTGKLPHWHRGLVFKVLVFLSLALAPIGVIAIIQSKEVREQSRMTTLRAVTSATRNAAQNDRKALERTFGAAEALGTIVSGYSGAGQVCKDMISEFLESNPGHDFAAFITRDGQVRCAKTEVESAEARDRISGLISEQSRKIDVNYFDGPDSGVADTVYQPIFKEESFAGFFALSIPKWSPSKSEEGADRPRAVANFNTDGRVLLSAKTRELEELALPVDLSLADLANAEPQVFSALDKDGVQRTYSTAVLVPGAAMTLAVWDNDHPLVSALQRSGWLVLAPILMWGASVLVAVFSLERLVIRPVRNLSKQMDSFALRRELPDVEETANMPSEVILMQENFRQMALHVTQDEAELESLIHRLDALLKQKSLLLKEVHHRVKNNLQLISSIMNMQLRETSDPETIAVLRRLQDRIMGLASAHQVLHQTDSVDKLDGGQLLKNLSEQLKRIAGGATDDVEIALDVDPIELIPDQAVPFSLLASELVSNALKYATRDEKGPGRVSVGLWEHEPGYASFEVTNAISKIRPSTSVTGLGTKLVRAFTTQLDADITQEEDENEFKVMVRFKVLDQMPMALDY